MQLSLASGIATTSNLEVDISDIEHILPEELDAKLHIRCHTWFTTINKHTASGLQIIALINPLRDKR
jgi:hypothetical protein